MSVFVIDASGLVKVYVIERGTVWVQSQIHPSTGNTVILAATTPVEIIGALTRRERGKTLTPAQAQLARTDFETHLAQDYQI